MVGLSPEERKRAATADSDARLFADGSPSFYKITPSARTTGVRMADSRPAAVQLGSPARTILTFVCR
jgi:hypothetical protein